METFGIMAERRTHHRRQFDKSLVSLWDEFYQLRNSIKEYRKIVKHHIEEIQITAKRLHKTREQMDQIEDQLIQSMQSCDKIESNAYAKHD
jgi:septal ring factor EnvC (AmiA/AmiB activator)